MSSASAVISAWNYMVHVIALSDREYLSQISAIQTVTIGVSTEDSFHSVLNIIYRVIFATFAAISKKAYTFSSRTFLYITVRVSL